MLLLMHGIEPNPGPEGDKSNKPNFTVRTYNCNGLGNIDKFRRVLIKAGKEVQKGGIILLQETHIVDEDLIKLYWKMKYASSCVSTNSGGVMILYDNSWELLEYEVDDEGRFCAVVIENEKMKLLVVNLYCPNNHRDSFEFMENVYDKIYELLDKHPDSFVVLGGDFNACMSEEDYLNRNKTRCETKLTDYIKANNKTCGIMDSY